VGDHRAWGHLTFRRFDGKGKLTRNVTHTMEEGVCGR
jgi:hypothetical protein